MTISKSNFIAISITMVTILILFQFSNISAIYTSQSMHNKNAGTEVTITAEDTIQNQSLVSSTAYSTAIIGNTFNKEAIIAEEWCLYSKRTYYHFPTLADFAQNYSRYCRLLIVSAVTVNTKHDVDILYHQAKIGVHIIFTSLPKTSFIRTSNKLKKLIGIRSIYQDSYHIHSITMYDGFLLGGRTTYEEYSRVVPFFRLRSGTKTYITGNIQHQQMLNIKNEDLPPLLWRNQEESSFIFVVNCDFFQDHTGLGMLTAMLAETRQYYIYPIVNAQTVICQNYPYLSDENSDTVSRHYYHTSKSLCENVLWPNIVAILSATNEKFNGMIAPKLEYSNSDHKISDDSISFYFDQNEKISGELGLSGDQLGSPSFYDEKIHYDTKAMKTLAPDYIFTIFSPGNMRKSYYEGYLGNEKKDTILSSVRTLIMQKEFENTPVLSFYNNNIISMANTINGFSHTNEEDLYFRSIETALGYSSVSLDFTRVLYPTKKSDDWTQLSKDLSRYLETYWKEFRQGFEQVTVSEADSKVRNFFALNYTSTRKKNRIALSINNFENEISFILILNDERIASISGAEYIEIESGRYVITTSNKFVNIQVTTNLMEGE